MNKMKVITQMVVFLAMGLSLTACAQTTPPTDTGNKTYPKMNENNKVVKTDKEWRALLSDEEYRILREQGTERPFTGDLYNIQDSGMYVCAACGNELFSSEHKFESGSGWPSYWQAANNTNVEETVDKSHGMIRREVHCAKWWGDSKR